MYKPNILSYYLDVFFVFCLCNILLMYNDKMQQELQANLDLICEQPLSPIISGRFCLRGGAVSIWASLDLNE